jgi:hypothetical protein
MSKKTILYILLVVGIVLVGAGAWLLYDSTTENAPEGNPVTINIHQDDPVIYEKLGYIMRGEFNYLYIYGDGGILYIEEKGLRIPLPERPATRTWSTGNFTAEQVNSLLAYFENSGLDRLEEYYNFPGEPEGSSIRRGDLEFTITVVSGNFSKSVTASGYLTPDKGETYPDMPSPLNEIYGRLRTLAMATEEVYQENISP